LLEGAEVVGGGGGSVEPIEDQVRLCRTRIETEGWSLFNTYTDHAISGASRLRPGYQKLLEDARAGTFDIVVAEALDRLSRDQEDTAALYNVLFRRAADNLAEGGSTSCTSASKDDERCS
jgi:DNA invertase Pin-like site-specific DNA recombinase